MVWVLPRANVDEWLGNFLWASYNIPFNAPVVLGYQTQSGDICGNLSSPGGIDGSAVMGTLLGDTRFTKGQDGVAGWWGALQSISSSKENTLFGTLYAFFWAKTSMMMGGYSGGNNTGPTPSPSCTSGTKASAAASGIGAGAGVAMGCGSMGPFASLCMVAAVGVGVVSGMSKAGNGGCCGADSALATTPNKCCKGGPGGANICPGSGGKGAPAGAPSGGGCTIS